MTRLANVALAILLAGALGLSSVRAQEGDTTPVPTASPAVPGTEVPAGPTPAPAARDVKVRATLKVEAAADGRGVEIPGGSTLRVRTAAGTCLEIPLPPAITDAVSGGGEAALPEFTIPSAATQPGCAEAGKALSIELALPDGSSIILFAGTWGADMPEVWDTEFVIRPPVPQPGVSGLPPTGGGDASGGAPAAALAAMLVALAVAGVGVALARQAGPR
ncbi:MAG TPA: hypothetical protein VNN10_07945 [Dehalococcoidia bacterium]|nr:hypothetical protein [Dehalococcoidia bacterium]